MKLHRFFISNTSLGLKESEEFTIEDKELVHQWRSVLRLEVREKLVLLDNSGMEYYADLAFLDKKAAKVKITKVQNTKMPKKEITLCFSLIKKIPLEWMLEKAVEIGVSEFQPIVSERSEVKEFNLERANKILKEACEQSGRAILPKISKPLRLKEVVSSISSPGSSFAFDSNGSSFDLRSVSQGSRYNIFIGPEGGWSEGDLSIFKEGKISVVSLGTQTLRAETASIATLSMFLLQ